MSGSHGGSGGGQGTERWGTNVTHTPHGDGGYVTNVEGYRTTGSGHEKGGHPIRTGILWVGSVALAAGLTAMAMGSWFSRPAAPGPAVEDTRGSGDRGGRRGEGPAGAEIEDTDTAEVPVGPPVLEGTRLNLVLEGVVPNQEVGMIIIAEGEEAEVCPTTGCGPLEAFKEQVRIRTRDEVLAMLTRENRDPRLSREEALQHETYRAVESARFGGVMVTVRADARGIVVVPSTVTVERGGGQAPEVISVDNEAAIQVIIPNASGGRESLTYNFMLGSTYPQGATLQSDRTGRLQVRPAAGE